MHQHRHRNLHKMKDEIGNIAVRDPQRSDTSNNGNGNGNGKASTKSDPISSTDFTNNLPSSLVSVVFVTASPTFTGEVAGYTTLTPSAIQSSPEPPPTYISPQPQSFEASSSQQVWIPASTFVASVETTNQAPPSTSWIPATTYVPSASSTAASPIGDSSITPSTLPTSIAMAVSSSTLISSYASSSRTATHPVSSMTASASATAAAEASTSKGMSSGGKVGLAIGIILVIALVAGGALWFYWKKKRENDEWHKADDEKTGFGAPVAAMGMGTKRQSQKPFGAQPAKHDSLAPRLSLRPVTQFIPDLAAAKKRLSQGNPLNRMNKPAGMAAAGADRSLTRDNPNGKPSGSPWERRAGGDNGGNPFQDPVNPFGDQAKAASPPPPNVTITPPISEDGNSTNGVAAGAAVGAVGATMVAGAANQGNGRHQNGPDSPPGAPVAGAAPPPGNVHRVQLDFKPSMEDELELRAGQLVRVLHEYDDGWVCWPKLSR
jgi:hypothetical protein